MDKDDRIYQELIHEQAAIWYISDSYGSKVMVKVPTPTIKALIKGCKIEFTFGRDKNANADIFHIGARIYDDPINYQTLFCAQRYLDEHLSLAKIMHLDKVQIQFYNELSVCQAYGDLILEERDRHEIHVFLGNPKKLHKGIFDATISHSLDNFQYSLGFDYEYPYPPERIDTLIVEGKIHNWDFVQNHFYDEAITTNTFITDNNEGDSLEKEILITLVSLFGREVYKNPKTPHKNTVRELTDIFSFSQYGIFLIEAKALGITNVGERTMERKVLGLQKQIDKAVKQIVGAAKKISEGATIYDDSGKEILFDRTLLPHGIVLVSELLPFGDWDKTIDMLLKTIMENNIMIHIMDLKEYMRFIGYAKGDKHLFDYFLMQRIENFVKHPSIFMHTEFVNREKSND